MKNYLLLIVVIAAVATYAFVERTPTSLEVPTAVNINVDHGDSKFTQAFADHSSNIRVQGQGTVVKILSDDTEGSRHQRFIIRLDSGQTLLIAHNIDLAPRVSPLNTGDLISFNGEYEWNNKGGVIHWTHHDPAGRHAPGWIKRDGQIFQ
ncbi:MAG TPA: DUF3465 domain-containing protein [Gammaproteobacteria bacterium]|nr:DUF3465 domain-containing protein [Gammaproteobacteria bacterium]